MGVFIRNLSWDDYRVDHIARHGIDPDEVWEVCTDRSHLAHREGQNRYRVYGQTATGRYLFVVLEHTEGAVFKPITARPMTAGERQSFRRLQK
jgi:uncharacterized DUF497 family protein